MFSVFQNNNFQTSNPRVNSVVEKSITSDLSSITVNKNYKTKTGFVKKIKKNSKLRPKNLDFMNFKLPMNNTSRGSSNNVASKIDSTFIFMNKNVTPNKTG